MIIRAITTNHGKTIDRFTVYFFNNSCLTMSANADSPQGVSQWSEYFGINDDDFETGKVGDETMINWFDLPIVIQAHVEKRIKGK